MSATMLKPWVEVVSLHPDVLSEHFSEDIFALDLGPSPTATRMCPRSTAIPSSSSAPPT